MVNKSNNTKFKSRIDKSLKSNDELPQPKTNKNFKSKIDKAFED